MAAGTAGVESIERVDRPTPEAFHGDFVLPGRPAIITGVATQWPAFRAWTFDYFRTRFGGVDVWPFPYSESGDAYFGSAETQSPDPVTLREFIDGLLAGSNDRSRGVLRWADLASESPEYLRDIEPIDRQLGMPPLLPAALKRRFSTHPGLWMAPAGNVTGLHFDMLENFNVQFVGRKRWLLYAPSQSELLYFPCRDLPRINLSPVDAEAPDFARHPRFAEARAIAFELRPGEIVFVPTGWWHHVRTVETSISLNYWWRSVGSLFTQARIEGAAVSRDVVNRLERLLGRTPAAH